MALEDDLQQIEDDSELLHDYVHGGPGVTIVTEGGTYESLGEKNAQVNTAISNMQSAVSGAVSGMQNTVASAISDAQDDIDDAVAALATLTDRGAWATGTTYSVRDLATESGVIYICLVPHTSGTFATDLAAGRWAVHQGDGKLLGASVTYTVGASGDFSTINDALEFVSEYRPVYSSAGIRVTIQLQSGFAMAEQIICDGIDLAFVTITAVAATVSVDPTSFSASILVAEYSTAPVYPAIAAVNGGRTPLIDVQFVMSSTVSSRIGCLAYGAGSVVSMGDGGVTYANIGCMCANSGFVSGNAMNFSNASSQGVQCYNSGTVSAYSLAVSDCQYGAYAGSGGRITIDTTLTAEGCVVGAYAFRGGVFAHTIYCEGCQNRGVQNFGGTVSAYQIDARMGASDDVDIDVGYGGFVMRQAGTGGAAGATGSISVHGYISQ